MKPSDLGGLLWIQESSPGRHKGRAMAWSRREATCLMKAEVHEMVEKMRFWRTENIISDAVFGQTCLNICKSKQMSKQVLHF